MVVSCQLLVKTPCRRGLKPRLQKGCVGPMVVSCWLRDQTVPASRYYGSTSPDTYSRDAHLGGGC